jgi:trehalose monomycolate/heme transporter
MERWARLVTTRPLLVVLLTVAAVLASGLWGLGVFDRLNLAGYADPTSESAEADRLVDQQLGRRTPDIVVVYTAPEGRTVEDLRGQVMDRLAAVDKSVLAKPIESYWTSPPQQSLRLVSPDQRKGLAVLTLNGDDSQRLTAFNEMSLGLQVLGAQTDFSGQSATTGAYNSESRHDLAIAESIAIPLTLALLVVIFGGFAAAAIPVCVGGLAVFGSLGALHALSTVTDVSAFALNTASILGLGMAIDYGLLTVSRFREELGRGLDPVDAARRTIVTAGRTVLFSALLLAVGLAGMSVFRLSMVRSVGYGAIAAVGIAAFLSLAAVPALLTVLGHRVNALPWRRGAAQRGEQRAYRFWSALATKVTQRPVLVAVPIVVGLALISAPIRDITFGGLDVHDLPKSNAVRATQEMITAEFPLVNNGATIVIRGDSGPPSEAAVAQFAAAAQSAQGVTRVDPLAAGHEMTILHAVLSSDDFSNEARDSVAALRALPPPPGTSVLIGGENAVRADSNTAVLDGLPIMLAIMIAATLVLMLLAFRSIVLPIKAVAMAALSLTATLGVLTWIFVEGHGAAWLGVEPRPLPAAAIVMVIAVIFGLSTDYEVFLVARMVEAHDKGADTVESVREGLASTGRVITAAALLLVIVTGAAGLSQVALMKIAGVGMAFAIVLDATVVRMLLVPALVTLMGPANWWMPGRFWRRGTPRQPETGSVEPQVAQTPTRLSD